MPYIKDVDRDCEISDEVDSYYNMTLDFTIRVIQDHIQDLPDDKKEGCANYIISRIVAGGLKPAGGWRYMWLNRAYGTFLSAAAEFNRRAMTPYENKCIKKSGDIPEYEEVSPKQT